MVGMVIHDFIFKNLGDLRWLYHRRHFFFSFLWMPTQSSSLKIGREKERAAPKQTPTYAKADRPTGPLLPGTHLATEPPPVARRHLNRKTEKSSVLTEPCQTTSHNNRLHQQKLSTGLQLSSSQILSPDGLWEAGEKNKKG